MGKPGFREGNDKKAKQEVFKGEIKYFFLVSDF